MACPQLRFRERTRNAEFAVGADLPRYVAGSQRYRRTGTRGGRIGHPNNRSTGLSRGLRDFGTWRNRGRGQRNRLFIADFAIIECHGRRERRQTRTGAGVEYLYISVYWLVNVNFGQTFRVESNVPPDPMVIDPVEDLKADRPTCIFQFSWVPLA